MLRFAILLAIVAAASSGFGTTFGLGILAGWVIGQFLKAVVKE